MVPVLATKLTIELAPAPGGVAVIVAVPPQVIDVGTDIQLTEGPPEQSTVVLPPMLPPSTTFTVIAWFSVQVAVREKVRLRDWAAVSRSSGPLLRTNVLVPPPAEFCWQTERTTLPFPPVQAVRVSEAEMALTTLTVTLPESSVPLTVMAVVPPEAIEVGDAKTLPMFASARGTAVAARKTPAVRSTATGKILNKRGRMVIAGTHLC